MPAGALPFCFALYSPSSAVIIIISTGNHSTNQIARNSLLISEILPHVIISYGVCYSSTAFVALATFRNGHLTLS